VVSAYGPEALVRVRQQFCFNAWIPGISLKKVNAILFMKYLAAPMFAHKFEKRTLNPVDIAAVLLYIGDLSDRQPE